MNNKEFIQRLSSRLGYTVSDTQRMVTNVIDKMSDGFQEGHSVSIPGFGSFDIKKKLERIMVLRHCLQALHQVFADCSRLFLVQHILQR